MILRNERYQREIRETINFELDFTERVNSFLLGIAGETGELIDHFKKHFYQGHLLDAGKVAEEAGDILWYLGNLLAEYKIEIKDVMEKNIEKLKNRYPNGFSENKSVNRDEVVSENSKN